MSFPLGGKGMKFIKLKDKDGKECYYRKCLIIAVGEVEGRVRNENDNRN